MTGPEMVYEFKLGFDVIASGLSPGFTDDEIYKILNRAYDYYILDRYNSKDYVSINELVKNDSNFSVNAASYRGYYIDLPADFLLYIECSGLCSRIDTGESTGFIQISNLTNNHFELDLVGQNEYIKFYDTKFNSNRFYKNPKAIIESGRIYMLPDSYTTISNISLTYVKRYSPISSTEECLLNNINERKIVDLAIDTAKNVINSQLPQSK